MLARRGREAGFGVGGQRRDGALAARDALHDRQLRQAASGCAGVQHLQVQRAVVVEALTHQMAVGDEDQLRIAVHGREHAARAQGLDEAVARERHAVRDQHRGTVGVRHAPVGAMIVLVAAEGDVVAGFEQGIAGPPEIAAPRFRLVALAGKGRAVHHLAQGHDGVAVRRVGQRLAVHDELAALRRMVELADPATLVHQGVQGRVIAARAEGVGQQFAFRIGLPAEQLVAVEDVQVAAIADHAPLHAVQRQEVRMRGVEVERHPQAGLVQGLAPGRVGAQVGAVRAVVHVVVLGDHQQVQPVRVGVGVGRVRTEGCALRILGAGAAVQRSAAVAVVALAVQVAVIDRVRQRARRRRGRQLRVPGRQRRKGRQRGRRQLADFDVPVLLDVLAVHIRVQAHVVDAGRGALARHAALPAHRHIGWTAGQGEVALPARDQASGRRQQLEPPAGRAWMRQARVIERQGEGTRVRLQAAVAAVRRVQGGLEFPVVDGNGRCGLGTGQQGQEQHGGEIGFHDCHFHNHKNHCY